MFNLLAYSGLTTKVRGMSGKLINESEYIDLTNLTSVKEVIVYLEQHPGYHSIFEDVDYSNLHRGGLEQLLMLSAYKDFEKLYNFSSIKQRNYLNLYFTRYETHLLKQILREILDKQCVSIDLSEISLYFNKFSDINLKSVCSATSVEEFIDALSNTKFYPSLKRVSQLSKPRLFDYEMCLDLFYFNSMWCGRKKYLSGIDYKIITKIYGSKIDLLNLQWIYRAKKYYNVTFADIYALLIPINFKLGKGTIKRLVECESVSSLLDEIKKTFYGKYIKTSNEDSLEKIYKELLERQQHISFKNNPYSLACVDSYLSKKQQEISKLITLTECIRYSFTPAEIKLLIK